MSNSTSSTSYFAAGEEEGIRALVTDFYSIMNELPEARNIRDMHKEDLAIIIDKLTLFLCMWLGGPRSYTQKYSSLGMPQVHMNLVINEAEKEAWLLCMDKAINKQNFSFEFKEYLRKEFRFPANMILKTSKFS